MKLLILNGPNLNLLGLREPEIYGSVNYETLCRMIRDHAAEMGAEAEIYQSNHEGDLVDQIQSAMNRFDGIVINPAAYTHTSVALLDALRAVQIPTVEVHISDVDQRESFRRVSYVRPACVAAIIGHGVQGYLEAMDLLLSREVTP
jgi:3-dehydroquinate dehydratase type II